MFKRWLGAKIAGPQGYGDTMGRAVVANAEIFSDALHESVAEIKSSAVESRALRLVLYPAAITFTYFLTSNAASRFMRGHNAALFHRGLAPSVVRAAASAGIFDSAEAAQAYLTAELGHIDRMRYTQALNIEEPGVDDVLGLVLERARANLEKRFIFTRTGERGFAEAASILAQRTITSIADAARDFRW